VEKNGQDIANDSKTKDCHGKGVAAIVWVSSEDFGYDSGAVF
jgi:hypothetical protein